MSSILKSPARYIQGNGVLEELDKYLKGMGNRFLFLISESGLKRVGHTISSCFSNHGIAIFFRVCGRCCTMAEIEKTKHVALEKQCAAIVGVGGGSILDTAKAAAHLAGMGCVMVPTVVSNDSPCSSCSVVYTDVGRFERCIFLDDCPQVVVVDTGVIIKSPVRFLVAGMGDAMATYFEARSCQRSGGNNQLRSKPTVTAGEMATLCWNYLKKYGLTAKEDAEAGVDSLAFETIVEVNTYLSSVGFESGGLAAAHALQTGLMAVECFQNAQHGELVAFCTIVQLVMEKAEELEEVLRFCVSVGLPVCFDDFGYKEVDQGELLRAVRLACAPKSTIYNLAVPVRETDVLNAVLEAHRLGRAYCAGTY